MTFPLSCRTALHSHRSFKLLWGCSELPNPGSRLKVFRLFVINRAAMRIASRLFAVGVALATLVMWLGAGANRGWTKTSIPIKTVDPVTGLEAIEYQKRFVPGLEILGTALLGAGALAGVSFLFRRRT